MQEKIELLKSYIEVQEKRVSYAKKDLRYLIENMADLANPDREIYPSEVASTAKHIAHEAERLAQEMAKLEALKEALKFFDKE